nr:SprT family zinc-dependent metalloprotease [Oculatella sp. LEGE 06141]
MKAPPFPVGYTVRVSPRAKHVRLKFSVDHGLEVIIPQGFDRSQIPDILHRKQAWIQTTSAQIEEQRQLVTAATLTPLPEAIALQAVDQTWLVEYQLTRSPGIDAVEHSNNRLLIQGNTEDISACKQVLRRWVIHRATIALVPWLRQVSQQIDLEFGKASVRSQKTLWASCSHRKSISLNCKLLFLPPPLVHYVFVHELCHTIHLNHSSQFWTLVGRKEPNYEALDQALRQAWRYVPPWLDHS